MTVRSEQTLRRMWDEHLKLTGDAGKLWAEADHSQADALAAELAASAHRSAEEKSRDVSTAMSAEAADLADLVNRERGEAGLSLLKPGEPYETPAEAAPVDETVVDR